MPNWEEPHVHMDLVCFDATLRAGNRTIIEDGYLHSLADPEVDRARQPLRRPGGAAGGVPGLRPGPP